MFYFAEDGVLSQDEYREFYRRFVGVSATELDKVVKEGYRAMTAVSKHL